jgi:hypothetical protein
VAADGKRELHPSHSLRIGGVPVKTDSMLRTFLTLTEHNGLQPVSPQAAFGPEAAVNAGSSFS